MMILLNLLSCNRDVCGEFLEAYRECLSENGIDTSDVTYETECGPIADAAPGAYDDLYRCYAEAYDRDCSTDAGYEEAKERQFDCEENRY